MQEELFEEVGNSWPVRYPVTYEAFELKDFGTIRDPGSNEIIAIVRDVGGKDTPDLPKALASLAALKERGINAASYLPFSNSHSNFLIVEYLEGPQLWHHPEGYRKLNILEQDNVLEHAKNLGKYYLQCFQNRQHYLVDIVSSFQYLLVRNKPVLVDLDLHLRGDKPSHFDSGWLAGIICEIGNEYSSFLNHDQQNELAQSLEAMVQEYDSKLSILSTDSSEIFDTKRWHDKAL